MKEVYLKYALITSSKFLTTILAKLLTHLMKSINKYDDVARFLYIQFYIKFIFIELGQRNLYSMDNLYVFYYLIYLLR